MVEEDAVAGEHAVGLTIVDHHPVCVQLGNTVRGPVQQICKIGTLKQNCECAFEGYLLMT